MTIYAFPSGHNPKTGRQEEGMTLRDYFAKDFAVSIQSSLKIHYTDEAVDNVCKQAYVWADAMLKARDE